MCVWAFFNAGNHFFQEKKGEIYNEKERRTERTPTLSPSPKHKERSPSPDCPELKKLRELKAIQELVVKDSEKYVAEPPDPKLFEYDEM